MAKRKQGSRRPQACHQASKLSQHDRRARLERGNPARLRTEQAAVPLTGVLAAMVAGMACALDQRIAFRLAKRAAHRDGWETLTYHYRGVEVTRSIKTFLATSRLTGGQIRVVIVRYEGAQWAAYFCTDPTVAVREILEAVAARWALEEHFHDVKEVWGAGQQQVRNVWSNLGCWHLNQWLFTLVELCSWDRAHRALTNRGDRPWDNAARRPSHAARRRTIAQEMLRNQFPAPVPATPDSQKFLTLIETLLKLCA
ncbi:MAG: hypothetical protein AABP62_21940 [Planctomycetota bacterium]